MKYSYIIMSFFMMLLTSCIGDKSIQVVKYKSYGTKPILKVRIPKGYIDTKYFAGGNEYEQEYLYNDSIILFITNFDNTRNCGKIREQGTAHKRFEALILYNDSLTLSGKDNSGRYWKDRLLDNGITIGYENVSENRKLDFDKALNSVKM